MEDRLRYNDRVHRTCQLTQSVWIDLQNDCGGHNRGDVAFVACVLKASRDAGTEDDPLRGGMQSATANLQRNRWIKRKKGGR